MAEEIKVSVIVPVYNAEKYLRKCMDSICGQTLKNTEIICVDDGSTDQSPQILDEYASRDGRVRVIHQENRYAGAARNRGMDLAKGTYLSFLDADDWFKKDILEVMAGKADETGADIVLCISMVYTREKGIHRGLWNEIKTDLLPKDKICFSKEDVADDLFRLSIQWTWDKMFRREFINKKHIRFQDIRVLNDGYFVNLSMAEAKSIVFADKYLTIHRDGHPESLGQMYNRPVCCCWEMLTALKESLKERDLYKILEKGFINLALSELVKYLSHLLYLKNFDNMEELYFQLKESMFSAIGIQKKPKEYFYDKHAYQEYKKIMTLSFPEYLFDLLQSRTKELEEAREILEKKVWSFPLRKLPQGSRVILYGAGDVGQDLYRQFQMTGYFKTVKWVDRDYESYRKKGLPVDSPDCLKGLSEDSFDYVIIGVLKRDLAGKIRRFLKESGIPKEKIVWENLGRERGKVCL